MMALNKLGYVLFAVGLVFCLGQPATVVAVAPSSAIELIDAVRTDDRVRVERLVSDGVDVSAPQGDGATALHWSVHRDNLELTSVLLDAGADVNAADDHGVTPLALACVNGSAAMVELSLKHN